MRLPETWREVRLDLLCQINPALPLEERPQPETLVSFVPMSAIDEVSGTVAKIETRPYVEVAKGYTSFKQGDILFAKVTPCMENGKATIAPALENGLGFGSTEFHVLRPGPELLPEYLYYFIRQLAFRIRAAAAFVGSGGLQRVPSDFLARFKFPLPTIPEQHRIVEALGQVELIAKQKGVAVILTDKLALAMFEEIFGVTGPNTKWKTEGFGKHTTYSKYGPRFPDQQYTESGIHILRTTDMNRDGTIRWQEAPKLSLTNSQIEEHTLKSGTLLVSRSGTIGPVALYDGPEKTCVAGAYLIEFGIAETLVPEYVRTLFMTPYIQQLMQKAVQNAAIPNLNAPNIKRFLIPIPPMELQLSFARKVNVIREWQSSLHATISKFDELKAAILSEAFTGELTANWREDNIELLRQEAAKKPATHKKGRPIKATFSVVEHVRPHRELKLHEPKRGWLIEQLSDFQNNVRWALYELKGTLVVDDPDALDRFCEQWPIENDEHLHDRIRRALDQLAALGLIAKVSVRKEDENGDVGFLIGYRFLRDEERECQVKDVDRLENMLAEVSE